MESHCLSEEKLQRILLIFNQPVSAMLVAVLILPALAEQGLYTG